MKATIQFAGKQFNVAEGDKIKISAHVSEVGNKINIDSVLFANDGTKDIFGTPTIPGASVEASVLNQGRDRKILIYKKKRRKGYQRKNGHRQYYSFLLINSINLNNKVEKSSKQKAEITAAGE